MKQRPAVTILTGELDLQASRSLGQRLNEEVGAGITAADVILDLSAVSFMDSSALTSLVNDLPQAEFALGLSPLLATVCKNPTTRSLSVKRSLRANGDGG